eukprot:COSAG01_NODE_4182_length_5262_cov_62.230292_2_plen_117_part_00
MSARIEQFDPTGLERGAKALREINQSPHAAAALQLQLQQQRTRQLESETQKTESESKTWEKRKDYLEAETKEHQKRADYEDKLARARAEEQRCEAKLPMPPRPSHGSVAWHRSDGR